MRNILKVLQDEVQNDEESIQSICEGAFGMDEDGNPNKSHNTLYRELNPDDKGAKLGLLSTLQLLKYMMFREDFKDIPKSLQMIGDELGVDIIPRVNRRRGERRSSDRRDRVRQHEPCSGHIYRPDVKGPINVEMAGGEQ